MAMGEHHSATAKTVEWLTPPSIVEALGPFDLDPASPVDRPWDTAKKHYTIFDDGLSKEWRGKVWMNPPYGQATQFWMRRLAAHGNGIAMIFARTETAMFFESIWPKASAIFFFEGRINFHYPDGSRCPTNSGAPSVLVSYGYESYVSILRAWEDADIRGKLLVLPFSYESPVP